MDLRNLKTFHIVSTHLNFTKAAEILNYSQPTVSQQIKALEDEIGHPLLNRVGKKMFLSEVGKLVKTYTDKLFGVLDELERDLKKFEEPYGTLTVASPGFYCEHYLPHIIAPFIKLYPQVNFKLLSYNSKETLELISSNKADIGFIAGKQNRSGIREVLMSEEDLVLVAHPVMLKGKTKQELFNEYPFITYGMDEIITGCLREIHCTPKTIMKFGNEEAIKKAVMRQAGVALLSDLIIKEEVSRGSLQVICRFPKRLATYLIHPQNLQDFANVRTFIELATEWWGTIEVKDETL